MIQVPCLLLSISVLLATPTTADPTPSPTPSPALRGVHDGPPCHHHPPGKGPPLPTLDPQFEVRIEATIKQKGYTMDMVLYYDHTNNKGAVLMTKAGVVAQWAYNFEDYEGYFIQGQTCQTVDLRTQHNFQLINVTDTPKGGHICGVHDLFSFGSKYNETFVATNEMVRGMPVNRWTSCVEQHGALFRLDYYFTKENYSTPIGPRQIPVRATLNGIAKNAQQSTKDVSFSHVYEFVSYRAGPSKGSVFNVPQGVVCKHSTAKRDRPQLSDRFTMGIEVVQPMSGQVSFSRQYFDYTANLTRIDLTPSHRAMTRSGEKYGYRPLRIIHDYSTGVQYVIDATEENCSTETIPQDSVDAAAVATDPSHVHMRHGADMFGLRSLDLEYQGQRTVRDVPCEVWSAFSSQWHKGVNTTIEAYWAPADWMVRSDEDGSLSSRKVLYRIWVHASGSQGYISDYVSHVYDYSDDKPDAAVFDIGVCFPRIHQQRRVILQIPGSMESVVGGQPHHTQVAVRQAVALAAKVSPIRVNNIFFDKTSANDVDVWLTIYDSPGFKGNVEQPVPQATLDGAFENLKRVIDSDAGLVIKVISKKRSKSLKVRHGSLKTDGDVPYPWRPYATCAIQRGYTPGSMAGVGIMMLILGVIVGVVAAFFLWKRGTGIPYQVQD